MAASVLFAGLTCVLELTGDPLFDRVPGCSRASSDNLDAVHSKLVYRALTHVAGQHDTDPHLGHRRYDLRFAAATLGRGEPCFVGDRVVFEIESFEYLGQYPCYFMFNGFLFLLATGYEKLISRYDSLAPLRGWILVGLIKPLSE